MKKAGSILIMLIIASVATAQTYNGPESVEYDPIGNRYLISNTSSGQILSRDLSGNLSVFATGVSPSAYGLEMYAGNLYAACGGKVYGYNMLGVQIFNVNLGGQFLNGITHDNNGNLYVTDFNGYKIYKVNIATSTVSVFVSGLTAKPNGIIWDQGQNRLVLVSWNSNVAIKAISLVDSSVTTLATTSLTSCDGIALDSYGNFYVSNWGGQSVVKFNNTFSNFTVVMTGLSSPADIYYNINSDTLAVPNSGNNTVIFQSFAPQISNTLCNNMSLTLFTDSISWGASDGLVSGTDSMIRVVLKNTSNYSFAYPRLKFNFLDALPSGTTLETNSQNYLVITSAWNPGDISSVKCYFNSTASIPPNYLLHFTVTVINQPFSTVDTCSFVDTFLINLNPQSVSVININENNFSIYPNPVSDDLVINSSFLQGHSILITDISGKNLKKELINSDSQKISLIDFASGVYFISVLNSEGNFILTRKLIKE